MSVNERRSFVQKGPRIIPVKASRQSGQKCLSGVRGKSGQNWGNLVISDKSVQPMDRSADLHRDNPGATKSMIDFPVHQMAEYSSVF